MNTMSKLLAFITLELPVFLDMVVKFFGKFQVVSTSTRKAAQIISAAYSFGLAYL